MRLEARHQASGLNSRFGGGQPLFADYVARTREMIAQVRSKSAAADLEKIVDGNAPFELRPAAGYPPGRNRTYKRGVLLTHGLTDSPYFMRSLAAFFEERGFRVMAVLLPGNGTQPGDLLGVSWREWVKTVSYGADRLAEEADEIYLAGFSAGGALSICHGLRDNRVKGLFLFAPALRISLQAKWANMHKPYSWMIPSAMWLTIKQDLDIYKYESFPKNAAAQMYTLTQEAGKQSLLHKPDIPIFTVASADDATVDPSAILDFMMHMPHPSNRLVLYTTDGEIHARGFPQEKLELVNSRLPEQRILSSAHTALLLPPEDAHYGEKGGYSNCAHYYTGNMGKYAACISHPEKALQGEITEANLKTGTMRRLMYNPNFAALKISMKQFIDGLP